MHCLTKKGLKGLMSFHKHRNRPKVEPCCRKLKQVCLLPNNYATDFWRQNCSGNSDKEMKTFENFFHRYRKEWIWTLLNRKIISPWKRKYFYESFSGFLFQNIKQQLHDFLWWEEEYIQFQFWMLALGFIEGHKLSCWWKGHLKTLFLWPIPLFETTRNVHYGKCVKTQFIQPTLCVATFREAFSPQKAEFYEKVS